MTYSDLTGAAKVAIGLAIASLFVSVHFTETSTINGVSTCSHTDIAKIILGSLAVLVGGAAEMTALRADNATTRTSNMLGGGIAALIGLYSLLVGLGIVGGPC